MRRVRSRSRTRSALTWASNFRCCRADAAHGRVIWHEAVNRPTSKNPQPELGRPRRWRHQRRTFAGDGLFMSIAGVARFRSDLAASVPAAAGQGQGICDREWRPRTWRKQRTISPCTTKNIDARKYLARRRVPPRVSADVSQSPGGPLRCASARMTISFAFIGRRR